ncbi:extended synaptotagmin-3-like [Dendronephthya gigantea]|uniref:extended synaptotagmin-3-like n=1 Tax=Dendronephthya gigantea TaxID=151771 RepID=UPI00106C8B7D|nr:extended synaptotagmin-3-like [Dendronephthya gigantea]
MKPQQARLAKKLENKPIWRRYISYINFPKLGQYVGLSLGIWFAGKYNFSSAWIAMGLLVFVWWDFENREKRLRRKRIQKSVNVAGVKMENLPSWVFVESSERVVWMNNMIHHMWPYIGAMVKKILKENVEPAMQASLPSSLSSLTFETISFGQVAPKITGINSYAPEDAPDEFILDLDLLYEGDAKIKLCVKSVNMGVSDIQLRGVLRVIFKPFVGEPNPIGGLTVFFLNRPKIKFDLINLLNVLDIPGLKSKLRSVAEDVICSIMVLPNRIVVPMSPELVADDSDLRYPIPEGVVRMNLIEAKELVKMDSALKGGAADPYIILEVGAQKFRTKTCKNTLKPVWNEVYEAYVDNDEGQEITMEMFDEEKTSKDCKMGTLEVDITSVAQHGSRDLWLPLDGVKSGVVHLNLTWCKLSSKAADLKPVGSSLSSALLMVKIKQGKNLPNPLKSKDIPAVFCKVTIEDMEKETYHVGPNAETQNIDWKQALRFLVKNHTKASIKIEVIESKGTKKIGSVLVPVMTVAEANDMVLEKEFNLTDSGGKGSLACKFTLRALVPGAKEISGGVRKRTVKYSERSSVSDVPSPTTPKVMVNDSMEEMSPFEEDRLSTSSSPRGSMYDISSGGGSRDNLANYGKLELSLSYSHVRNCLEITVIAAHDLPARESKGKTSPYVRMYLLPDRSKKSRRETAPKEGTLNPVYGEKFEYITSLQELRDCTLDVAVKNHKSKFTSRRKRNFIGQVRISLSSLDLSKEQKIIYTLVKWTPR